MTTSLEKLILANKIDFNRLNSYKYLSVPFILERNYDPRLLSKHPDITLDYILENPNIEWTFIELSQHPNITLQDMFNHPELDWFFRYVSSNPNITLDDIIEHTDIPWDFQDLTYIPNMTIEFILNNKDKSWDWNYISEKLATESSIRMYPAEPWNFEYLTQNLNVSFEFIKQNPQYPWHYHNIPLRGDIPLDIIEKHNPDRNKMYNKYSDQLLKKYPFYLINDSSLFYHMNLENFDELPYITDRHDFNSLSHNPTLTVEFMRQHKNINYDFKEILEHNEHMTWDVILESDDEFHWTDHDGIYSYYGCRVE